MSRELIMTVVTVRVVRASESIYWRGTSMRLIRVKTSQTCYVYIPYSLHQTCTSLGT